MALPIRNARLKLSQGRLFWREVGEGTTLLFLHDAWNDGNSWLPLIEDLSADYHCIVPDLFGFGESERPKRRYSVELQVECLMELLETLRRKQVVIVGQGLGGWIAARMGLQHPELVRSLILLSPEGIEVREARGRWTWARLLMAQPPVAFWLLQGVAPIARLLKSSRVADLLQLRKQWRQSPVACKLLFQRRPRAIRAEQVQDSIGWLKVPLLLVLGDRASSLSVALTRAYAAAPESRLIEVCGGDELSDLDGAAIADAIRQWLASGDTER